MMQLILQPWSKRFFVLGNIQVSMFCLVCDELVEVWLPFFVIRFFRGRCYFLLLLCGKQLCCWMHWNVACCQWHRRSSYGIRHKCKTWMRTAQKQVNRAQHHRAPSERIHCHRSLNCDIIINSILARVSSLGFVKRQMVSRGEVQLGLLLCSLRPGGWISSCRYL
jgi:hypothetical protein